jgi:hypothetical protein
MPVWRALNLAPPIKRRWQVGHCIGRSTLTVAYGTRRCACHSNNEPPGEKPESAHRCGHSGDAQRTELSGDPKDRRVAPPRGVRLNERLGHTTFHPSANSVVHLWRSKQDRTRKLLATCRRGMTTGLEPVEIEMPRRSVVRQRQATPPNLAR